MLKLYGGKNCMGGRDESQIIHMILLFKKLSHYFVVKAVCGGGIEKSIVYKVRLKSTPGNPLMPWKRGWVLASCSIISLVSLSSITHLFIFSFTHPFSVLSFHLCG